MTKLAKYLLVEIAIISSCIVDVAKSSVGVNVIISVSREVLNVATAVGGVDRSSLIGPELNVSLVIKSFGRLVLVIVDVLMIVSLGAALVSGLDVWLNVVVVVVGIIIVVVVWVVSAFETFSLAPRAVVLTDSIKISITTTIETLGDRYRWSRNIMMDLVTKWCSLKLYCNLNY